MAEIDRGSMIEALIAELLGDVGKLHFEIKSLDGSLPKQLTEAADKLQAASETSLRRQAELAGKVLTEVKKTSSASRQAPPSLWQSFAVALVASSVTLLAAFAVWRIMPPAAALSQADRQAMAVGRTISADWGDIRYGCRAEIKDFIDRDAGKHLN